MESLEFIAVHHILRSANLQLYIPKKPAIHFVSLQQIILIILEVITQYFSLNAAQSKQFEALQSLYSYWNERINVISRKDIQALYTRHVLHSLAIAKIVSFKQDAHVLDVGTGGGFPGIPLAILFPETHFLLIDKIGKKIKVVQAVIEALDLQNVTAVQQSAQTVTAQYDFIVSRAVTKMDAFVSWVKPLVSEVQHHHLANGILYLKGGDLEEELQLFPQARQYKIADYFSDPFFDTKCVVHLPL